MDIRLLSKKYEVRTLDINDVDTIYDMSCKNEIFYKYHPPFITKESIVEDMKALPPNKSYGDKYYIGFFEGDLLVANMGFILGYPTDEIAFIGLFMTNIHYQNKGVGSNIIGDVCNYLKQLGYKKVRIGVDNGGQISKPKRRRIRAWTGTLCEGGRDPWRKLKSRKPAGRGDNSKGYFLIYNLFTS